MRFIVLIKILSQCALTKHISVKILGHLVLHTHTHVALVWCGVMWCWDKINRSKPKRISDWISVYIFGNVRLQICVYLWVWMLVSPICFFLAWLSHFPISKPKHFEQMKGSKRAIDRGGEWDRERDRGMKLLDCECCCCLCRITKLLHYLLAVHLNLQICCESRIGESSAHNWIVLSHKWSHMAQRWNFWYNYNTKSVASDSIVKRHKSKSQAKKNI